MSHSEVPFLDLLIHKSTHKLFKRLDIKPTDRQMYLRYDSEHAIRIHSKWHLLIWAETEMYHFLRRGYPSDIVVKGWNVPQKLKRDTNEPQKLSKMRRCPNVDHCMQLGKSTNKRNYFQILADTGAEKVAWSPCMEFQKWLCPHIRLQWWLITPGDSKVADDYIQSFKKVADHIWSFKV